MRYSLLPFILGFAAICVRIAAQWSCSGIIGADHWYWKQYIRQLKSSRQFPPVLPQYLLEKHQWYPPLFPLLLSRLPQDILEQHARILSIAIDIVRFIMLLFILHLICKDNTAAFICSALFYSLTPILTTVNNQLNPRSLGALFLDCAILLYAWIYLLAGPAYLWLLIAMLFALILLTHKMTTQLMFVLCLCAGAFSHSVYPLCLIPAGIFLAVLVSKGFYIKVLCAHWDILSFWNRNWRWLSCHPIKESPVYGDGKYETPTKIHRKGWIGFFQHCTTLFGMNPGAWLIGLIAVPFIFRADTGCSFYIFCWLFVVLGWSLLTTFVPFLKCLGAGYYYLYNAAFPTAVLWALVLRMNDAGRFAWCGVLLTLAFSIFALLKYRSNLHTHRYNDKNEYFDRAIDFLTASSPGVVMCLPPQWYDVIAYKTGKPVLFGAHGYGFKLIEPSFPRFLVPIKQLIDRHDIRYLVTTAGYLPQNFIADLPFMKREVFGPYQIYH